MHQDGGFEDRVLIVVQEHPTRALRTYPLGQSIEASSHIGFFIEGIEDRGPFTISMEGSLPEGVIFVLYENAYLGQEIDPDYFGYVIRGRPVEEGDFDYDIVIFDASGQEVVRLEERIRIITL